MAFRESYRAKDMIMIILLLLISLLSFGCSRNKNKDKPGMKTLTSKEEQKEVVSAKDGVTPLAPDRVTPSAQDMISPSVQDSVSSSAIKAASTTSAAIKIGEAGNKEDQGNHNSEALSDNTQVAAENTSSVAKEKLSIPKVAVLQKPETSYVTDEMFGNAVLSEGNLARLAAVMKKARSGEKITIGVIGGSITQGSLATDSKNTYGFQFYSWWHKTFPNSKINLVNAGIGATNSYLGVHRVDLNLLYTKPDVVVVEFSVNDSNTQFYQQTYEDLVRKILKSANNPAVILLYMTMEDGTSAEQAHMAVGNHYDLPQISYRQAILNEIKNGSLTWKDISPDNIHPNDKGHQITGELLWHYLNYVYSRLDTIKEEVKPLNTKPLFDEAYINAEILDSENLTPVKMGSFAKRSVYDRFRNNWTTKEGEQSIIFEVEAKNIGIMYYRTTDGKSGQYDVYIDDKFVITLDGNFAGGWGNYAETTEIFKFMGKAKHKIEIKRSKNSKEGIFAICGLLIS